MGHGRGTQDTRHAADTDITVVPEGTEPAGRDPAHLLAELLDRAVALQPETDRVIRACAGPGDPPIEVARAGGALVSQYSVLHQEVAELPADESIADIHRRAGELIMYHLELLNASLELALPVRPNPDLQAQRRALNGLGPPAQDLRTLRDRLHRQ
jgi:hypothetical protein